MKPIILGLAFSLLLSNAIAQNVEKRIQSAFKQFEKDPQLKYAISSLYVIRAKTGEVVFDRNSSVGLAGASTQKIITAATAFELLGPGYRFQTELGYDGIISQGVLNGDLFIRGSGDPSLGSWRWASTQDTSILDRWMHDLNTAGIQSLNGQLLVDGSNYFPQTIPDGWIWQDIGNYYGAGPGVVNWKENQFDLRLRSGKVAGGSIEILNAPTPFDNQLHSAGKGSGDNAYAYLAVPPYKPLLTGTIPIDESDFAISISDPDPAGTVVHELGKRLSWQGGSAASVYGKPKNDLKILSTYMSPSLDSLIFWFLRKSINLYGEAFVKTFSAIQNGIGKTDSGVQVVRKFWKERGIDEDELNMYDGSGLSPLNRLTTHAQVQVLRYAKTREWFPAYLDAFPEYNGMKMKSGTISDVKGFAGYHTSKKGEEFIFAFLVNNYNGPTSSLVNKMFRVLDELK